MIMRSKGMRPLLGFYEVSIYTKVTVTKGVSKQQEIKLVLLQPEDSSSEKLETKCRLTKDKSWLESYVKKEAG